MIRSMPHRWGVAILFVLAVLGLVAISSLGSFYQSKHSLQDLKQAAEERGLCCARIASKTVVEAMIVSTEPRSPEEIAMLQFVDMHDPAWIGRIYAESLNNCSAISTPPPQAVWGDLQLYGDPELIRYLTSQ